MVEGIQADGVVGTPPTQTLAGDLHLTIAVELALLMIAVELALLIAEEEYRPAKAGSIRLIRDLATTTTSLPTDLTIAPPMVTVDIMCIPPAAAWGFPSPGLADSASAMPWEATLVTTGRADGTQSMEAVASRIATTSPGRVLAATASGDIRWTSARRHTSCPRPQIATI